MKTAITAGKVIRVVYLGLTAVLSRKTSGAKFNKKQQNVDSYSNGKQNYKQQICPINSV